MSMYAPFWEVLLSFASAGISTANAVDSCRSIAPPGMLAGVALELRPSQVFGRPTAGTAFDDSDFLSNLNCRQRPTFIRIWSDSRTIRGLQIEACSRMGSVRGNERGTRRILQTGTVDAIRRVQVWHNDREIFGLRFDLRSNVPGRVVTGALNGAERGSRSVYDFPDGSILAGFLGSAGNRMDSLGFYTRRVGCDASGRSSLVCLGRLEGRCALGIRHGGRSNACCANRCGSCGGDGCSRRFQGSADFCCESNIRRSQDICEDGRQLGCLIPR